METCKLTAILMCCCVLLVQGFRTRILKNNNGTNYGGRILYGDYEDPLHVLYTVKLTLRDEGTMCGGSIIHEHFILSAAQCLDRPECLELEIYPSSYTGEHMPSIGVSECYIHEHFDAMEFLNDIGIVRTDTNLVDDLYLTKIPLPAPDMIFPDGTAAAIVGWGQTESAYYSHFIVRGEAVVYNWHSCNHDYHVAENCVGSGDCPALQIPSQSFCTIGVNGSPASSCLGDFGGPVIIDGVLAGIMSAAIVSDYECQLGSPSLHVQVSSYYHWIDYIINIEE